MSGVFLCGIFRAQILRAVRYVRFWHLADNPVAPADVRYWGNSGQPLLMVRDSSSAFDPQRTCDVGVSVSPVSRTRPAFARTLMRTAAAHQPTGRGHRIFKFRTPPRKGAAVFLRAFLIQAGAEIEIDAARHQPTYRRLARKCQQAAAQLATPQMTQIGAWRIDHPGSGRTEAARNRSGRSARSHSACALFEPACG